MNKRFLLPLLFIAILGLYSCSDDDPVTPPQFEVTITVTNPNGDPVSGLDLSLAADLPFYQGEKNSPAKASVVIPFMVSIPCSTQLIIEDISDSPIRECINASLAAGYHQWVWDGQDDEGNRLPSGLYWAHFITFDVSSSVGLYEERIPMYMAILDPARKSVGTTNAEGQIKLTDKKLFPHLFDIPDIPAVDENAQSIGTIQFTDSMRFQLADLANGGTYKFYQDITGSVSLNIVWDTEPKSEQSISAKYPVSQTTGLLSAENFDLGQPYPVPFN